MRRLQTKHVKRLLVLVGLMSALLLAVPGLTAAGGGTARWAAVEPRVGTAETPSDIAGPDDDPVVSFTQPGMVTPDCRNGEDIYYSVGDTVLYYAHFECWLPWFDAEGSGLPSGTDINALHDECGADEPRCDIYLSFTNPVKVPDAGRIQPHDVVIGRWIPETQDLYNNFQLVFDGSDVGLTTSGERIDAMFLFDEDIPQEYANCAALGWFSTVGNYTVRDQWGRQMSGGGEDVLGFCAHSTGAVTSGYWFLYHDGSAERMPRSDMIFSLGKKTSTSLMP